MGKGYISIHRELFSHWVWDDKPFSRGQAWIDLLLMANHTDAKFLLGNKLVEVERGEIITSELKLMDRWGWSKTKVRAFIELLQQDKMVTKKADKKKTTLIICNYNVWQKTETTEELQKNRKETTKEPQKDTINNVNKENNEEQKEIKDSPPDAEAPRNEIQKVAKVNPDADPLNPYHIAAQHFREMVLRANPSCKVPADGSTQLAGWARDIRLMFETDKRGKDQIRETLDYCFTKDSFWMHTCQSPSNFRRNYDKIRGNMLNSQKTGGNVGSFGRSMKKVLEWTPPDER